MTPRIETEALLALAEPSRPDFEARNADLIIRLETDAGGRSTHTSRTCAREWHELKALAEGKVALQPLVAEVQESRVVIDHLGDLLAHYAGLAATAEHWRQVSVDSLVVVTGLRAELAALRAAVFGSTDYAADLRNGNFVEMAQTLHAAQRGGLARSEAAEADLAAARAEIERLRARLEDRIHDC